MSIGILEVVILLAIVLVVFAGYFRKRLPQFGRSAGEGVRAGTDKARELASTAGDKAGDKWDPRAVGRKAGEGFREAREIRDSFKEAIDSDPSAAPAKPDAGGTADSSDDATAAPDEPLPAEPDESEPRQGSAG